MKCTSTARRRRDFFIGEFPRLSAAERENEGPTWKEHQEEEEEEIEPRCSHDFSRESLKIVESGELKRGGEIK